MYTACGDVDKPSAPRPRPDIPKTEPGVARSRPRSYIAALSSTFL